jgi:hypothetical protein
MIIYYDEYEMDEGNEDTWDLMDQAITRVTIL